MQSLHLLLNSDTCDVPGLKQLTSLHTLSVGNALNEGDLTKWLPVDAPLQLLSLNSGAIGTCGLRGLAHWSTLSRLHLGKGKSELTMRDFEELAAHPALDNLLLHRPILSEFKDAPELPGIETLHLWTLHGTEDLSNLPRVFPNARHVAIAPSVDHCVADDHYAALFPNAQIEVLHGYWNRPPAHPKS
ncbi:hypothetical protein AT728_26435 [Streptomyces silvensis]|uniref:Leucine-rich repeat domain-containing protein n=2 Tax=Streptomyces silvensis TaxID=1765722 RepID=A0A0W7WYC4_9ACTN|nr:hypothetical protein AT728_26435 [Streptomyces silvensis]